MKRSLFSVRGITVRVALLGLACAFGNGIWAQTEAVASTRTFVYSAKFVCRNVFDPSPSELSFDFGPAFYRTVVNIHNTSRVGADLRIGVVEATRMGSGQQGEAGGEGIGLRPNEANFVSCAEIRRLLTLPSPQRIIDGFVIIESKVRLDVAAVYTGVSRQDNGRSDGVTIDVETIEPRIRLDAIADISDTR
jgi:hypothetical protein